MRADCKRDYGIRLHLAVARARSARSGVKARVLRHKYSYLVYALLACLYSTLPNLSTSERTKRFIDSVSNSYNQIQEVGGV